MAAIESVSGRVEPPGTIKVSDNLYIDKTELNNYSWLEYLYWIKKVFGEDSFEYKQALPDQKYWTDFDPRLEKLNDLYLNHPLFRDYPVVGVSYEQVKKFTTWRSDRVMELFLIRASVIEYDENQNRDSYFTIEKYFNGQYLSFIPNETIQYYPQYGLLDSTTYYLFSQFADSLNNENFRPCKKRYCSNIKFVECNCLETVRDTSDFLYCAGDRLESNFCYCNKRAIVTHLKGNAREMTNIEGVFYGLSFIDSCSTNFNQCRPDSNLVNSYTGFRNLCRYKKWGE